ncbi:MAG: AAA family ATPase [Magnetococcales bacterium]|nr:AAA family ATPase [Magnetococcales bacterium]
MVQHTHGGVVIAAHADQKPDGLFVSSSHKEEFSANPDLMCVEVTTWPIAENAGLRAKLSGNNSWRPDPPFAAVMTSSDAKSLATGEDGKPAANCLGYRHTWIKMSQPSIEALRQAFLDAESRIRPMEPDDPASREKHARLEWVEINGAAFLGDQRIDFSPHLNCLIGGRGSGKSAILESMRLALGKERDSSLDEESRKKVARIKTLLDVGEQTEVRVGWRSPDGVRESVILSKNGIRVEPDSDIWDMETHLGDIAIQFFSQQQLNRMTEEGGLFLLPLLNGFVGEALQEQGKLQEAVRVEIRQLFARKEQLDKTDMELRQLTQELADLERQWQAVAALQEEAQRHQGLQEERNYINQLKASVENDKSRLLNLAADIFDSHSPLGSTCEAWPHGSWFLQRDQEILKRRETLRTAIVELGQHYRQDVEKFFTAQTDWPEIRKTIWEAEEVYARVCADKGIAREEVSRFQEISRKRQEKGLALQQKQAERERLRQEVERLPQAFERLHAVWREAYAIRVRVAEEISAGSARDGRRLIQLSVAFGADQTGFQKSWNSLCTDRRSRLGRNWEELGDVVFEEYRQREGTPSVWGLVQGWLENELTLPEAIKKHLRGISLHFEEVRNQLLIKESSKWREVRVSRVADRVDLELLGEGGRIGRISDGTLSDGQRNTAVLAMILAKGNHPLVIDQPEDELDAKFIYGELVPLMRHLKSKRQIILSTHNANLPVNGDAELVCALEAKAGKAVKRAEGGLDREEVTRAVLDILEGSEQAFRKRKEKYHF